MGKLIFRHCSVYKKIRRFLSRNEFLELGMLAVHTEDEEVIDTIIQVLYQAKQYRVLNDIYLISSQNEKQRRNRFLHFYEIQCETLKQKIADSSNEEHKEYTDLLRMIIMHTLSSKENTPSYGEKLVDLWIPLASSSDLIALSSLILNNYPEKIEQVRNALIHHNNLFHLYQFSRLSTLETLDLELISYLFHLIKSMYEQMQENEHYQPFIPKEQVILMYQNLQNIVMEYNGKKVEIIQQKWGISGFEQSDLTHPENPILSLLDIAPISEDERKIILFQTSCDGEFQNELLTVFHQRKENPKKVQLLDFYYVLYSNPIQKKIYLEKEQNMITKIQTSNAEYLLQIERQLQIGQINEEDVIGSICGQHIRPIFGLFSYLSALPLEDLVSIASNISFPNPLMREELLAYLKCCKEDMSAYNEKMQELDVQYVKSKLTYENMLKKRKEF